MNGKLAHQSIHEKSMEDERYVQFLHLLGVNTSVNTPINPERKFSSLALSELRTDQETFTRFLDAAVFIEKHQTSGKIYYFNFSINYETHFGQNIVVTGDPSFLGNWEPQKGIPLEWTPQHNWKITFLAASPSLQDFNYKYVLVSPSQTLWENGPNHVCICSSGTVIANLTSFILEDYWQK